MQEIAEEDRLDDNLINQLMQEIAEEDRLDDNMINMLMQEIAEEDRLEALGEGSHMRNEPVIMIIFKFQWVNLSICFHLF